MARAYFSVVSTAQPCEDGLVADLIPFLTQPRCPWWDVPTPGLV